MSDEIEATESVVEEAKERFEIAKAAYAASRSQAVEDTKFYLGDSDNGYQWPQNIALQRSTIEKRPCLTINVTAQHVNQIVNTVRENPPTGKVLPVDDFADKKTAEILSDLIRNIQASSSGDDVHNIATEHAIVGGEGYWRIVTEYASEDSFDQVIKIKPILDPGMVYIDPYTKELDKSDAEWGFVFEDITKDECQRLWPNVDVQSWTEDKKAGWVKDETVRIADYYCVEYLDDVLYQLPDGSTEYKSKMPKEIVAQLDVLVEQGQLRTRKAKRKEWKIHKLAGGHDEPMQSTVWVGSILPIVQVVGKELLVNGEVIKKGLVRDLKDAARMVNYSYSAAIESVALQNKIPYLAPADAIEGYEDKWNNANTQNLAYLPYNHVDDAGNPIPMPQRQPPAILPTAQIQLLQLSVEQMRAASGQQSANFGIKSEAASGVGIQRLKVQGEIATFHFLDALNRALKYEIRVLLELICSGKILDTARVVRVMGIDGTAGHAVLDPNAQQSYQEINQGDIQKIFNPTIGQYDVVIDTGPSYMTKRTEGAAQLTQIMQGNPQMMQVAGDLVMKAMDVPYADKIADRMQKMLPPQLQDQKGNEQIPAGAQQAMQMAQQHIQQQDQVIQQMQEALQKKQAEEQKMQNDAQLAQMKMAIEQKKLELEAFKAETERAAALHGMQSTDDAKHALESFKAQLQQDTELYKAHLDAEVKLMLGQLSANTTITAAQMNTADNIVDGEEAEFRTGKQEQM